MAAVAEQLLPSTVQISAEYEGQDGGATGSGFVLDSQGHIITNNHVVEQAAEDDGPIEIVDQDGNRYDATVVGRSPVYDLAVLYVRGGQGPAAGRPRRRPGPCTSATPSSRSARRSGLSSTVTAGIVSALHRPVTTGDSASASSYINAVQTDAAINPGNSGWPAGQPARPGRGRQLRHRHHRRRHRRRPAGNIGVGFAIPIEQVKVTADQILRTGEARYPVIGAKVQTGQRDGSGAEIDEVVDDTPAADGRAGEGRRGRRPRGREGHRRHRADRRRSGPTSRARPSRSRSLRDGEEKTLDVTLDSEVG